VATLTPTKDRGATTKPVGVLYVEPDRAVIDDTLRAELPDVGFDAAAFADVLSAVLAHERCGRHLYRSCARRTRLPDLERAFEEFGAQTERHVEILEEVITGSGGNPNYVSPMARAVEGADSKLLESTYVLAGSIDPATAEISLVDAVFLAESMDHANWQLLGKLVRMMPEGAQRTALEQAVAEVEEQEDEHLAWATQTKQQLITQLLQAGRTP
jgi:ferritin-like metal-binding protein YciE